MKHAYKALALSLALLIAAPTASIICVAPAAAGNWSGSTQNDGNGNSIQANGDSTQTTNADGSVTTTSTSTTTWTDLATGKVVKVIKRSRSVTKKGPKALAGKSSEVTTVNNVDGSSTVVSHEGSYEGNTSKSSDNTQHFYEPNGQGDLQGGDATRTNSDGKNTTKEHDRFDPKSGQWVAVNDAPAHHARLLLPILGAVALLFGLMHHNGNANPNPNPQPQTEPQPPQGR